MTRSEGDRRVSRRAVLRASGGAVGLSAVGGARAHEDGHDDEDDESSRCPEATLLPSAHHCDGANMAGCADDHPETVAFQEACRDALEAEYPTVGTLIDREFVPYFDTVLSGESNGYSHWLSPEFIGDDVTLDPERPESVLVDNASWQPIGVMFIATHEGEAFEPPPAVHGGDDPDEERCAPWHYHAGLPDRFAWWYYRQVYERDYEEGEFRLPCRTPCMMHVWTIPNPNGVYAHGPPPSDERDEPPADGAGFETAAEPGEDELDWDVLPDEVVPDVLPGDLR